MKNKKLHLVILLSVITLCSVFLLSSCKSDEGKYNDGLQLMLDGDYEAAVKKFSSANGYADSKTKLQECENYIAYADAIELMEKEQYDEAKTILKPISDLNFLDSKAKYEECTKIGSYNDAVHKLEEGKVDEALASFTTLGDFKDCKDKVLECNNLKKYNEAVARFNEGDVKTAAAIYQSLGNFKDAPQKYAECNNVLNNASWDAAAAQNTLEAYAPFLADPNNAHYKDARNACDELSWQNCKQTAGNPSSSNDNKMATYAKYINEYQDGKHVQEAKDAIDALKKQDSTDDYNTALTKDTILALQNFIAEHPDSDHKTEALAKIESMKKDDKYYTALQENPSESAVNQFLKDYPGHAKTEDAKQLLNKGKGTLKDLTAAGMIAATVKGPATPSTQKCRISITNISQFPVTVSIPLGTNFISHDAKIENLVVREEVSNLVIPVGGDYNGEVKTASMNFGKQQPSSDTTYEIGTLGADNKLYKLMKTIRNTDGVSYEITQAAVWIVTDEPTNQQITNSLQYSNGTKVISKSDVEKARKIVNSIN